jgi:Cu-Zn family superoxide dismutase
MMIQRALVLTFALATLGLLTGCQNKMTTCSACGDEMDMLVAAMHPTQGNKAKGKVTFEQIDGGVKVVADITGLTPNAKHGFHIHEFGDCSAPDGASAGGHYNPEGHDHALPNGKMRHAGDLGNLTADASGNAHYEYTAHNISLCGMTNPILGRGVIIHAKPDDGGQPVGNAGARIACGVIGIAKSK